MNSNISSNIKISSFKENINKKENEICSLKEKEIEKEKAVNLEEGEENLL